MEKLSATISQVPKLEIKTKEAMFQLYAQYYGGTNSTLFLQDLDKKQYAILLCNQEGHIKGFSTIRYFTTEWKNQPIRVLFSGDTIVDQPYWGRNELASAWISFAGEIKAQATDIPLYWFLIVKGHRTYRYLSVFSKTYYPAPDWATPLDQKELIDTLAYQCFGSAYNANKGVIHFPESQGHLLKDWAKIPKKDLQRPEVQFFLAQNPDYDKGDELVCLCELHPNNLKPLTQRIFCHGMQEKKKIA